MAAGGKGHARRRENTAAVEANWDAIFSKDRASRLGANPLSKSGNEGPIPSGAATFDAESKWLLLRSSVEKSVLSRPVCHCPSGLNPARPHAPNCPAWQPDAVYMDADSGA